MNQRQRAYIAELNRGYLTSEYSHSTRSREENRLDNPAKKPAIEVYAERNGELHVLCHEMLGALEAAGVDPAKIHAFRARLHNVPQSRIKHE